MRKTIYGMLYFAILLSFVDNIIPIYAYYTWQFLIVLVFFAIILLNRNRNKAQSNLAVKFMWIWVFYSCLSLFWTGEKLDYFLPNFRLLLLGAMITFTFFKVVNTKQILKNILICVFIAVIFHNILGWYEYFTGNYLFISDSYKVLYQSLRLPTSTFYNTNDFSTFLTLSIFFILLLKEIFEKRYMKLISDFVILSSVLLVYLAGSRANLIGSLLGVGLVFIYKVLVRRITVKELLIVIFGLFIIVISFGVWINVNQANFQNLDFSNPTSDLTRINLIKNGLYFLTKSFGLGIGVGNIEYMMQFYAIYPTFGLLPIHNWWIEILVTSGFLIFIFYLYLYIKMYIRSFQMLYKKSNNEVKSFKLNLIFLGLLSAFIFCSMSTSSLFTRGWFWMLHSLIYLISYNITVEKGGEDENLFRK
ncbi:O-antigen ligase family protein [Enterococcus sp. HY326]|uniref:O-antigen ligase family protein n=1 Tax=Enterococcus sp. HY326 TaxID=2971265 RepID=UPI00224011CC|nr:O-antigen ligase family protein [Enterococcus sp. HY326]